MTGYCLHDALTCSNSFAQEIYDKTWVQTAFRPWGKLHGESNVRWVDCVHILQ